MDAFFPDSNQIPAQIPCRHCSVLLEKLLLMPECNLIQTTEDMIKTLENYLGRYLISELHHMW